MEEAYLPHPLNIYHVQKFQSFINRIHILLHSTSLLFLFYYRLCFLFQGGANRKTPFFLWLLIFLSETILSFIWILGIGYRWRPVSRAVFPERLPEEDDELLPPIDVFICTVDPTKEPTEDVMNTVLSAMSLDYPPDRLHVYVSDDGGSSETLRGMREAWRFARWWLPFCRKYKIKRCCPKVYFSDAACEISDDGDNSGDNIEFVAEKRKIKKKYDAFVEEIMRVKESRDICGGAISHDHPSLIEVIEEDNSDEEEGEKVKLPHLVYVCREKRPSHPHNFKAGALNVLLRVSAVMSNAPYFLALDCDMFCNDPTSARKALCFHLDPKISKSLAFVQFPHKFQNITNNDIYDNAELIQLQQKFGSSNEFIKALKQSYTPNLVKEALVEETKLLASCNYEIGTKWGQEVGFFYASVVEDVLTGTFETFTRSTHNWRVIPKMDKRAKDMDDEINHMPSLWMFGCFAKETWFKRSLFLAHQ
ncbi:cellulose synthase-like protein G2 [Senna tora]|uniref:Cellulose synthase-like protein G2 n=1 Tax=Senna tora TaxID=362788 RepID=A0A834W2K9_9FABA|nr:cellulose synthase-like protein G2 [Senna tora]